jgi:hypothetical protein
MEEAEMRGDWQATGRTGLVAAILVGCSAPDSKAPDAGRVCADRSVALSRSAMVGPTSSSTFDLVEVGESELAVIAIASMGGSGQLTPSMAVPHDLRAQVHSDVPCRNAITVWSIGNVTGGGNISIEPAPDTSYVAIALVFAGLRPDAGSRLYSYAHGRSSRGPSVVTPTLEVCPGDVAITSAAVCGEIEAVAFEAGAAEMVSGAVGVAYNIVSYAGLISATWNYDGEHGAANLVILD